MKTKYVRIERGPEYRNREYTTVRVALDMIKTGEASSYTPITLKTIKAERLFEYREADYFRHKAEDAFIKEFNGKQFKATVISWSGTEGLVKIHGTDLMLQTIYACNIAGKRTWYPETACVSYTEGQQIDVRLDVFAGGKLFVVGLTQGTFDADQWARLDQDKLAFKCNEQGEAINGLFGQKRETA